MVAAGVLGSTKNQFMVAAGILGSAKNQFKVNAGILGFAKNQFMVNAGILGSAKNQFMVAAGVLGCRFYYTPTRPSAGRLFHRDRMDGPLGAQVNDTFLKLHHATFRSHVW
jgi:hypothetical protein